MTVLILAPDLDPTADCMVALLGERGVEVFRVNTAWFPTQVQVSVELHNARWHGALTAPHGKLDLDRVQAVWYRSPEAYQMAPELSPAEAHHARVEAKYGLGGVLASLPVLWCNHPSRVADAAYKPVQLARAAAAGLAVPDTLITNEPDAVRKFAVAGATVTKLVGGMAIDEEGVRKNVYTRLLEQEDFTDLHGIEHTTHLFQRWVPKARECRYRHRVGRLRRRAGGRPDRLRRPSRPRMGGRTRRHASPSAGAHRLPATARRFLGRNRHRRTGRGAGLLARHPGDRGRRGRPRHLLQHQTRPHGADAGGPRRPRRAPGVGDWHRHRL
ncbi:MAG: hypothetical protein JO281_22360 [Pseudonocardiales bacterium]|nr:hypothetical protein [Pseudonocardiales bacterium]